MKSWFHGGNFFSLELQTFEPIRLVHRTYYTDLDSHKGVIGEWSLPRCHEDVMFRLLEVVTHVNVHCNRLYSPNDFSLPFFVQRPLKFGIWFIHSFKLLWLHLPHRIEKNRNCKSKNTWKKRNNKKFKKQSLLQISNFRMVLSGFLIC